MSSSNNYEKLDEIFGTQSAPTSTAVVIPPAPPIQVPVAYIPTGDDIEDDYQVARQKLNTLIDKSQQALDGMLNVALASDSPRAYEVVGQLIKTLSDTNKDLLDLGKKVKELKSKKDDTQQPQHVTNALFVGSTAELQKLIGKR